MADTAYDSPDSTVSATSTRAASTPPVSGDDAQMAIIKKLDDGTFHVTTSGKPSKRGGMPKTTESSFQNYFDAEKGLADAFGVDTGDQESAEPAPDAEAAEPPAEEAPPADAGGSGGDMGAPPVSMSGPADQGQ